MQQLVKYSNHLQSIRAKKAVGKKIDYLEKEVLNLTQGFIPVQIIDKESLSKNEQKSIQPWTKLKISNQAQGQIFIWSKPSSRGQFQGLKYNTSVDMIRPTKAQCNQLANQNWSSQETQYFYNLAETFSLNFIVMADRYNFNSRTRDVVELKHRYFQIAKAVLELRGQDHPLRHYNFDQQFQRFRKRQLEKSFLRSKEKNEEQKRLAQQLKRLDAAIKRQQRQQILLKKALKLDQNLSEEFTLIENEQEIPQNQRFVYTRGQWMQKPLPLPAKINSKLSEVLLGLGVPQKVMGKQANQQLFDELRKQILTMFSLQRCEKKKLLERSSFFNKKKQTDQKKAEQNKKKLKQ